MITVIKLIGIFVVAMGLAVFFNPKIAKRMMAFWRQGRNIYIAGLMRIALGSIFIYYSPYSKLPKLLLVLGALAILGGLLIFILGPNKTKVMIGRVESKPDKFLRLISLAIITFGILVIYSA